MSRCKVFTLVLPLACFTVVFAGACAEFSSPPAGSITGGSSGTVGGNSGNSGTAGTGGKSGASSGGTTGSGGAVAASGGRTGTGGAQGTIAQVDLTGKKALLVVDNPASLDEGDMMLQGILAAKGMIVTLASPAAADPGAASQNLIVGSSGASGAEFATLYKTSTVPILTFGNAYFQPMDYIATTSAKGNAASTVMLTIMDASSYLAASFAAGTNVGVISPTRSTQIYWATPAGSPVKVASVMGAPAQLCVFAFDKGAMMATAAAAGRRTSLCWKTDAIKDVSIEAYRLMNAAIEWTAGNL